MAFDLFGRPREEPKQPKKITEQDLPSPEARARKLVERALKTWGPEWQTKGVWDPDAKDNIQEKIVWWTRERNRLQATVTGLEKKAQSTPPDTNELETYRVLLQDLRNSETELAKWEKELHLFDRAELLFKYNRSPYIDLHRQRLTERRDILRQDRNELLHKKIDPKKHERAKLMRNLALKGTPADRIREELAAFYERNLKPLEVRYNELTGQLGEAEQELKKFNALSFEKQFYAALKIPSKTGGDKDKAASAATVRSAPDSIATAAGESGGEGEAAGEPAESVKTIDTAAGSRRSPERRETAGESEIARAVRLGEAYLEKHTITGLRRKALAQMLGLKPEAKVNAAWVRAARKFQAGKLSFPLRDKATPAQVADKKTADGIIGDVSLVTIRDTDWPVGGKPDMAALVTILFPEDLAAASAEPAGAQAEAKVAVPAAPAERGAQAKIPEPVVAAVEIAGETYRPEDVKEIRIVRPGETLLYVVDQSSTNRKYSIPADTEIAVLNERAGHIRSIVIRTPDGATQKVYVDETFLGTQTQTTETTVAKWFGVEKPKPAAVEQIAKIPSIDHRVIAEYLFDQGIAPILVRLKEIAELKDPTTDDFKDGAKVALPVVIAEGDSPTKRLVYLPLTFRSNEGNSKWEIAKELYDEEYVADHLQKLATNLGWDRIPQGAVSPEKLEQAYLVIKAEERQRVAEKAQREMEERLAEKEKNDPVFRLADRLEREGWGAFLAQGGAVDIPVITDLGTGETRFLGLEFQGEKDRHRIWGVLDDEGNTNVTLDESQLTPQILRGYAQNLGRKFEPKAAREQVAHLEVLLGGEAKAA